MKLRREFKKSLERSFLRSGEESKGISRGNTFSKIQSIAIPPELLRAFSE